MKTARKYSQSFSPGGCYIDGGMKNRKFSPTSRIISEKIKIWPVATVTKDPQTHSVRHYKTVVARRYNPAMMQVNICYLFISNKCTRSECVKLFDNKIVQTKCHSALPGRQWCPCRERYDLSVLCRHVAYWYADQSASCTLSSRSCSTSCSTVLAATVQRCGLGRRRRVD